MYFAIDGFAAYAETGSRPLVRAGKSILFVHGAGQDHSIWALQTRYFADQDCGVIAVDLPAHGRSEGEPLTTIEAIGDWLIDVLDAAGIGTAAIVGNSLGSLAAIAAAARNPARVRATALIGTSLPMPVSQDLLDAAKNNRQEAIDMLARWSFSKATLAGESPARGGSLLNSARQLLEQTRPGVLYTDLKACDQYAAGLQHAAQVRCPALLILGEHDRLTPARRATQLAETLPDAETVILEGCGHAMLAERPESVLEQLKRVV